MSPATRSFAVIAAIVISALLFAVFGFREKRTDSGLPPPASTTTEAQPANSPPDQRHELPIANLRAALAAVCSDDAGAPADGSSTQGDTSPPIYPYPQLRQNLSVSSSAEHLHLAAMLEDDPVLRAELLARAISLTPSDPFLIWGAVKICSESGDGGACPLRAWERQLIEVDGQNSETWIRIAANRHAAGDNDAALVAIRRAGTAAESRAYWPDTVEMVERGFAAGSDFPFPERASAAFALATRNLPSYNVYLAMCEERSAANVDWAYACLAYGELLERQGKTETAVLAARAIQALTLEKLGEVEKATDVKRRAEERARERFDLVANSRPETGPLIMTDPALFSAYVAAVRSDGEAAAERRIADEVRRLLAGQPGCDPSAQ